VADNLFRSQQLVQPYELSQVESEREGIAGAAENFRQARADELYRQHRMSLDVERAQIEQSAAQAEIQMNEVRKMEAQQRLQMANEMAMLGMNKEQVRSARLQNDAMELEVGKQKQELESLRKDLDVEEQLAKINEYYMTIGKRMRVSDGKPVLEDLDPKSAAFYQGRYARQPDLGDDILRAASSMLGDPFWNDREAKDRLRRAIVSGDLNAVRRAVEQAPASAAPTGQQPPSAQAQQSSLTPPSQTDLLPTDNPQALRAIAEQSLSSALRGKQDLVNKWRSSQPMRGEDDIYSEALAQIIEAADARDVTTKRDMDILINVFLEYLFAQSAGGK